MLDIGWGNIVSKRMIVSIVSTDSEPIKRLIRGKQETNEVVDATKGRKVNSCIITNSGIVVLSANQVATLKKRWQTKEDK